MASGSANLYPAKTSSIKRSTFALAEVLLAVGTRMSFTDAIIIYVACGSPFAIYRIALADKRFGSTPISALVSFAIWPLVVARWTIASMLPPDNAGSITSTRKAIESRLPPSDVVRFREIFELYTSLAWLTSGDVRPASVATPSITNERTPASLAVLARVNRRKAEQRLKSARQDLISVVRRNCGSEGLDLLAGLESALNDPQLTSSLEPTFRAGRSEIKASAGSV